MFNIIFIHKGSIGAMVESEFQRDILRMDSCKGAARFR